MGWTERWRRALSGAVSVLVVISGATLSGCAGSSSPGLAAAAPGRPTDGAALELLWSIEGHASECTVTRPTAFSDRRRSLLARWRPGSSLGYATSPRVMAHASCVVSDERGARTITRLRLSSALTQESRDALALALPFDVRWADEPCDEASCDRREIAIVAPDVVEITGPAAGPIDVTRPDVRRALTAEIAARPAVFEVSAVRVGSSSLSVLESVERVPRGVAIATRILGVDEEVGRAESEVLDALFARLQPRILQQELGWRVRGDVFERYTSVPWSLVEVEVGDDEIARETRLRRAERDRVVPMDQIDLDAPAALLRQAGARARAARVARDPARRRSLIEERARLLERIFELTEDASAVAEAVSLHAELGELEAAWTLALRAQAVSPEPLLRDALLRSAGADPGRLAAAIARLRPDLSPAGQRTVVEVCARVASEGVAWGTIEASYEVASRPPSSQVVRTETEVLLPLSSLAELGYLLLRATGGSGAFAARLEGPLRAEAPVAVERLGVRWPSSAPGAAVWATVSGESPTLERLRLLSASLRAQMPGAGQVVDVTFSLGSASVALRVAARGEEGALLGASRAIARAPWAELARDVARPVSSLEATRFPLPVLSLALSPALLTRVAALVIPENGGFLEGGRCTVTLPPPDAPGRTGTLACTGRERGPEALLDVLAAITSATLASR